MKTKFLALVLALIVVIMTSCGDSENKLADSSTKAEGPMSTEENFNTESASTKTGSSVFDDYVWSEYDSNNQYVGWMEYLWDMEYLYVEATDEVKQFVYNGLTETVWTNGAYTLTFDEKTVTVQQDGIENEYDYQIIAVCGSSLMDEGYNVFYSVAKINGEYVSLDRVAAYFDEGQPYLMLSGINSDGMTNGITLDPYEYFDETRMEIYEANNSEFIQKLWAEELTQTNMNIGQLIRNPNMYADGNMYRFTGYINGIERGEYSSWVALDVEDSIIVVIYSGWIEAIQGDQLTVYGYVTGVDEYNNSIYGTVQTAGVDAVYYTVGSESEYRELTEEEWGYITGDWYSDDSDRYIESTMTLTKDTINGRPYTIRNSGIGTSSVESIFGPNANTECGQYLFLDITEEAANGMTIDANLVFYFNGRASHATYGDKSQTYYLDTFYLVNFYR